MSPPLEEPLSAAVDALYAELLRAGENRSRAREILASAADERVLVALLRRALPVAALEETAAALPWRERPRVLAQVVLNPRVPTALAQRLVGSLLWRELAEVARTLRVNAAVRIRAESLLVDSLADMRLGDRITLARLATPALLARLLADPDRRVMDAALENARLREADLVTALRREDVRSGLVEAAACSPRWTRVYAVRLALALQPRSPLAVALGTLSALLARDLRRVAGDERLHALVRTRAARLLDRLQGSGRDHRNSL